MNKKDIFKNFNVQKMYRILDRDFFRNSHESVRLAIG